jgi:type IV pilus assembly protein PilO
MTNKIKQALIIIFVIFLGGIFCYYNYLLKPINDKYKDSANKLRQHERKLAELRLRIQDLPKLKAETELLQREVDSLGKLLPQQKEVPGLLRIITKRAQKNNLQINTLSPGNIAAREHYNEIPFQINIRGRYHSVARFLADIGQEARIITARDLNLTYSGSSVKGDQFNLTADFVLLSYMYKE